MVGSTSHYLMGGGSLHGIVFLLDYTVKIGDSYVLSSAVLVWQNDHFVCLAYGKFSYR